VQRAVADPRANAALTGGRRLDGDAFRRAGNERNLGIAAHVDAMKGVDGAILGHEITGRPAAVESEPGERRGDDDAAEDEQGERGAAHELLSRKGVNRLDAPGEPDGLPGAAILADSL